MVEDSEYSDEGDGLRIVVSHPFAKKGKKQVPFGVAQGRLSAPLKFASLLMNGVPVGVRGFPPIRKEREWMGHG